MPTKLWARLGILVAGLAILAALQLLAQWLRPSNPIVVSVETTVVTEPLTDQGLPDYVLEKKQREGWDISRDENGAVPFWQAIGQGSLEDEHWRLLCLQLGIDAVKRKDGLASSRATVGDEITAWLQQRRLRGSGNPPLVSESLMTYYDGAFLMADAAAMPWSADECPLLAESLQKHQDHFLRLMDAANRPSFYSPTEVSLGLSNEPDTGFNVLLALSDVVEPLCQRACLQISNGELDEAWRDLWTAMQLSQRVPNRNFIGYLVSTARFIATCNALRSLLASPAVSADLVQKIRRDLAALDDPRQMVLDCLYAERLFSISMLVGIANGEPWGEDAEDAMLILWGYDSNLKTLKKGSLDWNLVLRKMNANFDRMKLAASAPKSKGRQKHLDALRRLQSEHVAHVESALSRAAGYLSVSKRSTLFADEEALSSFDAFYSVMDRYDQLLVRVELLRTALAITEFRCEHRSLVEDLQSLVPEYLDAVPTDPAYEGPFAFEVLHDGYLVYSLGPNRLDDRACHSDSVFRGVSAYSVLESEDAPQIEEFLRRIGEQPSVRADRDYSSLIPAGADDIPYRISTPADSLSRLIEASMP